MPDKSTKHGPDSKLMPQGHDQREEVATFVFANCAGAARGETCSPFELAREIRSRLIESGLKKVVAIGLSEVILSVGPSWPVAISNLKNPSKPLRRRAVPTVDDLAEFRRGFGLRTKHLYYLAHLDSSAHASDAAHKNKWGGPKASPRLASECRLGRPVYQGTAALLSSRCVAEGIQLRPAGADGLSRTDEPENYQGNRDTEPRSALVFRGLKLAQGLDVDLCIFQLETHTQDRPKTGDLGEKHRVAQLKRLKKHLGQSGRPAILMGDFNAELSELRSRKALAGFRHIAPQPDSGAISHLNHRILIDHAFVRGLDGWRCELRLIRLKNENNEKRVSDHRPIALTIYGPKKAAAGPPLTSS
jgi:hypothetical protein